MTPHQALPAHPHADLMRQFAEDAAQHPRPWELWEYRAPDSARWANLTTIPHWSPDVQYRRRPEPETREFTVRWEIQLEAVDAIHAALIARDWQLDPNTEATIFTVHEEPRRSIVDIDCHPSPEDYCRMRRTDL